MKLTKIFATLAFAGVLGACSTASDIGSSVVDGVSSAGSAIGKGVVDGVKATGSTIGEGAKATGSAIASGAQAVKNTVTGTSTKTVAYVCDASGQKQPVSATYLFDGEKVKSATITLGKKVLAKNLPVDTQYTDGTQFADSKNVWNLSENLTPNNAKTVVPVMFTAKGAATDSIVARNCEIVK